MGCAAQDRRRVMLDVLHPFCTSLTWLCSCFLGLRHPTLNLAHLERLGLFQHLQVEEPTSVKNLLFNSHLSAPAMAISVKSRLMSPAGPPRHVMSCCPRGVQLTFLSTLSLWCSHLPLALSSGLGLKGLRPPALLLGPAGPLRPN